MAILGPVPFQVFIIKLHNVIHTKAKCRKKILWFPNFTCDPASNYSNSFTLVQQPQVNNVTLQSGKLL